MHLHPFGHGGDVMTAAHAAGIHAEELLDFSANINPLGPPSGLFTYLSEQLPLVTAYPDPACRAVCRAFQQRYRPKHDILCGNGAGELIFLLMRALPDGPVLMPAPTFTLYATAASAAGRNVSYCYLRQEDGYRLDVDDYCRQIRRVRPAVVMLCNPNNPTGSGLSKAEVLTVAEACKGCAAFLIVDEAFLEFHPDWDGRTVLPMAPDHVVVLCSMTKFYAVAGLRLGFLSAPAAVLEKVNRLRDPWSVNTMAQLAGVYVLNDRKFSHDSVCAVRQLYTKLSAWLARLPDLVVYPSEANYIFVKSRKMLSSQLQQECLKRKVLIRDCSNYTGLEPYYFRVAVRKKHENRKLVEALQEALQKEQED